MTIEIVKGPFELDGVLGYYRIICPKCGTEGIIDPDQWAGVVSCVCPACDWHEVVNIAAQEIDRLIDRLIGEGDSHG